MVPSRFPCSQVNAYQVLQLIFTLFIAPALQCHFEPAQSGAGQVEHQHRSICAHHHDGRINLHKCELMFNKAEQARLSAAHVAA